MVVGAGLTALAGFLLVHESITDDAYITLAYAKNLALDLHWGLIPQEDANTATSPLNVMLLGAVTAATRVGGGVHPILALGLVSVALAMVMAWGWVRVSRVLRLPFVAAVLGVGLVLVNPFLLSAIGLEVLLIPALLTLLLVTALEERPGWFGAVAGLALLARLDLVVFVLLIGVATPAVRRRWRGAVGALVLVAGPWFLFSWLYLGAAVPDTLVIKIAHGGFGIYEYADGAVMYYRDRPVSTVLAFLPAVLGVLALSAWLLARMSGRSTKADALPPLGPVAGLGAGGVAYFAVYFHQLGRGGRLRACRRPVEGPGRQRGRGVPGRDRHPRLPL